MKVKYDAETDILRVIFDGNAIQESDEKRPGVILDYDAEGNVVGLEILDASTRTANPKTFEYADKDVKPFVKFKGVYVVLAIWIVVVFPFTWTWFPANLMFHPGENEGLDASLITPLLLIVPILLFPVTGVIHLIYIELKRWRKDRLLTKIGKLLAHPGH